jgi:hypothetical protein
MKTLYVKFDIETSTVLKGPQELHPDRTEGWCIYIPYTGTLPLKEGEYLSLDYYDKDKVVVEAKSGVPINEYKDARRRAYPSIDEQLDHLWHDINNGTLNTQGQFYQALQLVKQEFPK